MFETFARNKEDKIKEYGGTKILDKKLIVSCTMYYYYYM